VVNSGAATQFVVTAPQSTIAGAAFSFTITALDASNNTATTYSGVVHFTSTDPQASLPANSTLSNGEGTFIAALSTAGAQTITATDTVNAGLVGTSNHVIVSAAAAAKFIVHAAPASISAGQAVSVTVTALDTFNNTASTYAGTVSFTSSDNQAVLPADSVL